MYLDMYSIRGGNPLSELDSCPLEGSCGSQWLWVASIHHQPRPQDGKVSGKSVKQYHRVQDSGCLEKSLQLRTLVLLPRTTY